MNHPILVILLVLGFVLYLLNLVYKEYRDRVMAVAAPHWRPLLIGSIVVVAIGGILPWAVSGVGYANPLSGNLTSVGIGGHRLYIVGLALLSLVGLTRINGRRKVVIGCALADVGTSAYILYGLYSDGGGLGAVGIGTWICLVAGLVLLFAADTLPRTPDHRLPDLAPLAAIAVIFVAMGAGLALLVIGLDIQDDKEFLAFALFITACLIAINAFGGSALFSRSFARYRYLGYGVAAAAAFAFPFTQNGNAQWMAVFARVGVFAAAAIGLNVVVGLAGLLDLGYIAFFGIGGYVSALLSDAVFTTVHVHLPFLLVIPLGAAVAAFFGVLVGAPTLRLRGDYLAIVTLGFGEIFRIVAINWTGLTKGPNGIAGIPDLKLPGGFDFGKPHTLFGQLLPFQSNYYFLDIFLIAGVMVFFARINDSRIGRAWVAIREDELAARAMGINTVALKLLAFGIGATLAGTAGTINVHIGEAIEPNAYQFIFSALLLSAVVLGGMGTVAGPILGAALLYAIPEKLRVLQDYRLFLFGAALILLMRFRPEGLIVSRRRQREFHEGGSGADAMSQPGQVAPV